LKVVTHDDGSVDQVVGAHAALGAHIQALVRVQLAAVGTTIVWATVGTVVAVYLVKAVTGLRVSSDVEREGLDLGEHGERAYNP
jgi:Amt family ammonium transporter